MKEQFKNIKPYKLASHKIWNVPEEERNNILKLDWNEATVSPSPKVGEAIRKVVNSNIFNYYPATYNKDLIEALADYMELPTDNIQYFAGSDSLHEYIAQMFINDGDSVVIVWPSYDNFRVTADINGANIEYFRYTDDFAFDKNDFTQFIKRINPVMVYICNPNNPTGYLHTVDEIEYMLKMFPDTLFLIDEAYGEFSRCSCRQLVLKYENIIISRTMSKAFALANFRFGYMVASETNIHNINTIRNAKNISTFSQTAVLAALRDIDYMKRYVEEVNAAKRELIYELQGFSEMKVYGGYGNFALLKFKTYEEKMKMIEWLEKNNIYVRDLEQDLSVRNCIRITVGTVEQMKECINIIKEMFVRKK